MKTPFGTRQPLLSGPSRPMDNTDFSFLWRKEMTKNFVRAALADLA